MSINYVEIEGKNIKTKTGGKRKWLKRVAIVLGVVVVLTIGVSVYLFPKVITVASDAKRASENVKQIQRDIQNQDVTAAKSDNKILRSNLEKTQTDLKKFSLVGKLPIINGYFEDAQHGVKAGILGTQAADLVADSVQPFGDILGLKGTHSNVTADQKIQGLVTQVLPSLSKKSDELAKIIEQIKREIDSVDENRYPAFFTIGGVNLKKTLVFTKGSLSKLESYLPSLKEFLVSAPSILGYQQQKTYILWFQNDKELRATGGFISAYGIIKVKGGKIVSIDSDDIYQLDLKFTPFEPPPPIYHKYLLLNIFTIRDANISPDFKLSAKKFESFYDTIKSMPKIDGIVAIDTELLRSFLTFTGPIKIAKFNETYSADINPVYKIPDVVYKLELHAEKLLAGKPDRKGIVGDMMKVMLQKILSSPPEKFPDLLKIIQDSASGKHLQFYFHDETAQKLSEDLNYAGRIKSFDGDYLHVNNSNVAGLKGNLYLKAQVEQDINIDPDGTVTKKVTETLRNTGKSDGWLNAVFQNWLRVYVPQGSTLISKQVTSDFAESTQLGKTMWESFSRTKPLDKSVTSFTYQLPFKVKKGQAYKLLMQKQGGTTDPHMIIKLNGSTIKEFDLKKDTEIEFKV